MNIIAFRGKARSFQQCVLAKTPIAAAIAAALCMEHPAPVYAADTSAGLEEVVVTATRRSQSIQDTPYNIAATTSDVIEELHLDKIDDVAHLVPGVSIQNQGAFASSNIVMRGLNTGSLGTSGGPNGVGAAVAEYLGEVPIFFDFKLLDIDRVETLIGPQGTLYGTGTLGGLIRYVPKLPNLSASELEGHVRMSSLKGGAQEGYDGDATFNVPLVEGKLAFRGVVGYYHDPGFINDTRLVRVPGASLPQPDFTNPAAVAANLRTERGVDFDHTLTARATLLFRPNDALDAELLYAFQRTTTDGLEITHAPTVGTGPYDSGTRLLNPAERKINLGGLVLTGHLGFADLVSATSIAFRRINQQFDTTDGFIGYGYEQFPAFVALDLEGADRHLYTEELRLVSSGESRFKWILGGFYEYFKDKALSRYVMPGYPAFAGIDRPDGLQTYRSVETHFSDKAVFGEVGYQLTAAWQVTVGGRWFKDQEVDITGKADPFVDGSPPDGLNIRTAHLTGPSRDKSIYKFNTSYRFTPDLMSYVTINEGYRAGGINRTAPCTSNAPTTRCLLPNEVTFKPDSTRNYELGLRSTWFDHRLTLNGAVYYIKWRDVRIGATSTFGADFVKNGSSAKSQGVELQVLAQLPAHLQLLGSYSYNDAKLTARAPGILSDFNGDYDGLPGDRLPASPQHMGSVHLQYARTLSGDYSLSASYGVSAQSNIYSTLGLRASGEKIAGYAVHDASLGLGRNNWSANFFVENLFNKYAFTQIDIDDSWKNVVIDGVVVRNYYHTVLMPRRFGLEVRVKFSPR